MTPCYLYLVKSGHLVASLVQRRAAKISRSWCDSNYSYTPSLPQLACAATLASHAAPLLQEAGLLAASVGEMTVIFKRRFARISQSLRRPLLGPSPGAPTSTSTFKNL